MSDVWGEILYPASYEGLELDVLLTEDDFSRRLAEYEYPRIDGADIEDMGARASTHHVRVIFVEQPISKSKVWNHYEQFQLFMTDLQRGEPGEFVHPLYGRMLVMPGDISVETSPTERDLIIVDVTFKRTGLGPVNIPRGTSSAFTASALAARAQARKTARLADEAGVSSAPATAVDDELSAWESDPGMSVREVNQRLAVLNADIADVVDDINDATDIGSYELWQNYIRLNYQLRKAAQLFRQDDERIKTVTLIASMPLRAFVQQVYGARNHERRYREVMRLNDIRDPMMIPEGTSLMIHVPSDGTVTRD